MTPSSPPDAALPFQDADAYDQFMGRWSRRLAPLLIGFGGLADGERIVDVGCGTGSLTFALPATANVARVVGIDATEPFITAARARNTNARITFDVGDARALPYADASFDRAVSAPAPLRGRSQAKGLAKPSSPDPTLRGTVAHSGAH